MAPRAEEGRDKLRKATGIGKYEMIRGNPNVETLLEEEVQEPIHKYIVYEEGNEGN